MAIAELEEEIGETRYKVRALPFSQGLPVLKKLVDVLAPIAAAAFRAASSRDRAASMLELIPELITAEDLSRFAKLFGEVSYYMGDGEAWIPLRANTKENAQEIHFAGRYKEFLEWIMLNVKVNFSSFFDGATSGSGDLGAMLAKIFPPLANSTRGSDSSGASSATPSPMGQSATNG